MSFWKLFGKRATTRPAAKEAPSVTTRVPVRKLGMQPESIEPPPSDQAAAPDLAFPPQRPAPKGGFDPYNTGTFDRRGNWDKMRLK